MPFLPSSSGLFKPEAATLPSSTLREWWREESRRRGTDWISLLAAAEAALARLRIIHGTSS
jgi:hypothetical protein